MIRKLTQNEFEEFKADYAVYGTKTVKDKYLSEKTVLNEEPKGSIHTMWHPITDAGAIAEYGKDIRKMFYAIVYDDPGIDYNDVIIIRGNEYEVVGIKYFNTHTRVEVSKKKV